MPKKIQFQDWSPDLKKAYEISNSGKSEAERVAEIQYDVNPLAKATSKAADINAAFIDGVNNSGWYY